MIPSSTLPRISAVSPLWAIEGSVITIEGDGFPLDPLPDVRIGGLSARLTRASGQTLSVLVPPGLDGGTTPIRIEGGPGETAYVQIGAPIATGLHQVDNPVFDRDGNLYVTFSGSRGQQAPVSIYVVRPDGSREPFVTELPNPTSMAVGPDGALYVSSRFDGSVHRVDRTGAVTAVASDLGVACGIAFGPDGSLYVGDRSGSILRLDDGRAVLVASIPPSVVAFHLAFGPDDRLYVTAPTLSTRDAVYVVSPDGDVAVFYEGFGRPQGIAFDTAGHLYVVDALAGRSGLFRFRPGVSGRPEQVLTGGSIIGLAFDPRGGMALASSDTVYRLDVGLKGLLLE